MQPSPAPGKRRGRLLFSELRCQADANDVWHRDLWMQAYSQFTILSSLAG